MKLVSQDRVSIIKILITKKIYTKCIKKNYIDTAMVFFDENLIKKIFINFIYIEFSSTFYSYEI